MEIRRFVPGEEAALSRLAARTLLEYNSKHTAPEEEPAAWPEGRVLILTGGLSATAGGITAAVVFGVIMALIFKPGDKR